jgi:hypothetical protein
LFKYRYLYSKCIYLSTNKHCLWWPCLSTDQNEMSNTYRGPSIDASYQVSVHLAKEFQRRRFLEIDQGHHRQCLFLIGWFLKNLLLWNCLAKWTETWWEASMAGPLWKMLNFSRSINKHGWHRQFLFLIGHQVSVYLDKRFQRRRFFRNQPIRNKHCLWWPCLSTDQNEISNTYRGPSIDASLSLEGPIYRLLISSQSINKHGHHRQFLFLIGWFLKNLLPWNCMAKWI